MRKRVETVKEQIDSRYIVATQEIHCGGCGRFLGFQAIAWGVIKIKCPNCKSWTTLDICPENKE